MSIKAQLIIGTDIYEADLSLPLDISLPLINGADGPKCFHAPNVSIEPVRSGSWVGSTQLGGIVNFKNVVLNPHGNGTHTESVGHISTQEVNINDVLTQPLMSAQLITIAPEKQKDGDFIIQASQIKETNLLSDIKALIIRTTPNDDEKKTRDYSETNPPYFSIAAINYIVEFGIEHLIIDLPSVDREYDDGKLAGHRAFWNYPESIDTKKTVTELVFVDNSIEDGLYLCDIQIINLAMDASPSRPILYKLTKSEFQPSK